jgi:caulimovirus viroplasmin
LTKYYAVKNGREVGIFTSWDACRASVDGFAGAEYKSFKTKKEALAFLGDGESGAFADISAKPEMSDIPVCPENELIAFVDGSFDVKSGSYGFGCVIIDPEQKLTRLNGKADKAEAATARNVAGELLATMNAVKYAAEHSYKKLTVYHDYEGIEKWYNGKWKAQSFVAVAYLEFVRKYRSFVSVSFVKVEAHTGNTLNEEADRLAKSALGIGVPEKKKKETP